jgi:hypothetical protein
LAASTALPPPGQQPGVPNQWPGATNYGQQPGGGPYGQQGYAPGQQWQPLPVGNSRRSRKRHRVRNLLFTVVGAIVLIIVIAEVANSGNGVTKSPQPASQGNSSPATQANQSQADNSTTGPIGTTFVVTDINNSGDTVKYSVTLDKFVQYARPDNSFDTAPTGDHLAGAELTIKGLVGDDQDDANSDAAAIGSNQQTYQSGFEGLAAGTNFNSGQFNTEPGSTSIGWVAFEVKNGVTVTQVQWNEDGGITGTAPATWTIGG